ncbi:DUF6150 family protein [Flammeovirga pectinis]|nr:DUF6150 family protein [Flammeovirga pectinis]
MIIKLLLMVSVLVLCSFADKQPTKVFITTTQYKADIKVFISNKAISSNGTISNDSFRNPDYLIVDSEYVADERIYLVGQRYRADLILQML